MPLGLTEDRYVSALQIREVNDVPSKDAGGRATVGGRYIIHHLIWGTDKGGGGGVNTPGLSTKLAVRPTSSAGGGRLLKAGENIVSNSIHLHSNGRDTTAHLEFGFKFLPKGYEPTLKPSQSRGLGNGLDISIHRTKPTSSSTRIRCCRKTPRSHRLSRTSMRRDRACASRRSGINIQTLSCAGYDHNWVRGYIRRRRRAALPKGTILHIIGYMDNSPAKRNVPDPRNWQGSGNRSVANMFIDLGQGVALSDEQFQAEMIKRRSVDEGRHHHRLPAVQQRSGSVEH